MDHEIDTQTGDLTGRRITGLHNAAYLRLKVPLGTWFGDTQLGSQLYRLKREKDTPRTRKLAIQYAEAALNPLLDDGRARSVSVKAELASPGTIPLHIEIIDAGGKTHTLLHNVVVA